MVITNHSWEEQTERLLTETISELKRLEAKQEELQNNIVTLTREKQAYEIALQGYQRRVRKQDTSKLDWVKLLEGKTHKEQLVVIAQQNDGKIRTKSATNLLYNNRLTKAKKRATAYSMVQSLLAELVEENVFEKVADGEYSLVAGSSRERI